MTARLLNLLDLAALARTLGKKNDVVEMFAKRQVMKYTEKMRQPLLFRKNVAE